MKRSGLICMIMLFSIRLAAQVDDSDKIVGIWKIPGEELLVKIDKIGDIYQGRIVWLKAALNEKAALDVQNPNEHLRNIPLKGNKIIEELTFDPNTSSWNGGTYYSYVEGMLYNCRVSFVEDDRIRILKYTKQEQDGITESWTRQ